ncbi:amino acid ABC transporter substrate-binding protein, PAAT family [[Leptolyngbya] sp. PCC 7376]|uniref:transporter substrate-binding domain-containing protein n=1 Tax=[Leptolyngbya] sp. PCC 7376 TaxID=111781 RepID=UPI00029EC899|nr:transporter substrate-binding domain-containing protein [[Leptolyngbya] sp. PCC 7376]AFY37209.1 amino acid ABC transporter substrate-binding protein, PAAT family [[Leptolyngbya] sp. PCC 7376]
MSLFSLHKSVSCLGAAIASIFMTNPLFATPLEDIQERGTIQIAVKENVRPLAFRDGTGELQGLEIDIARRLATELLGDASQIELIPVKNQERLDLLLQGDLDLVVAQLGVNASRQRLVDFSAYYYLDGLGFVTKQAGLSEAHQITTQRVAVLNSSEAIAAVQSYFPSTTLIPVNSYQEALALLENNQADAFAGDHSVLTGWTQEYPNYRLLPAWLEGNALAIALPKGNQHQSLYDEIQTLMAEWRESGWLQDRINHWGLP